jgi:AraC-like DNA-binding protein
VPGPHYDPFDDALEDLRVSGAVLFHEAYLAPWTVAVPEEARLRELLKVGDDVRIVVFHFVRHDSFDLQVEGGALLRIRAGEVVICPGRGGHVLSRGIGAESAPFDEVVRGGGPVRVALGTAGSTELICGFFYLRAAPLNPLLAALPAAVRVATDDVAISPILSSTATMLAHEIGRGAFGSYTVARLLEVFCGEAIRAYRRSEGIEHPGWFKGLSDPRVAEAIRQIHAEPARGWTVPLLASGVALSASRFAARFRETTGQSVMAYVAAWRANLACRMLRETELQLGEIAERVGYESLPAFSRAFKAKLAQSPTTWRNGAIDAQKRKSPLP